MEIKYQNVVLRDSVESDIEDEIRWNTVETEWALWDAPWEMEVELPKFNPETFRKEEQEALKRGKTGFRWGFEVDTADGIHIGSVNAYLIDENYEWIRRIDKKEGQCVYHTIGMEINNSQFWNRGLGTQALACYIRYLLDNGYDKICTQTWSGNFRMVRCAEKLGFDICERKKGIRIVRGAIYDGLTFRLDVERFKERYC